MSAPDRRRRCSPAASAGTIRTRRGRGGQQCHSPFPRSGTSSSGCATSPDRLRSTRRFGAARGRTPRPSANGPTGVPRRRDTRDHDLALVEADVPRAWRTARTSHMKVGDSLGNARRRRGPQLDAAGLTVHMALDHRVRQGLYVTDPDGNLIELYVDVTPGDVAGGPVPRRELRSPRALIRRAVRAGRSGRQHAGVHEDGAGLVDALGARRRRKPASRAPSTFTRLSSRNRIRSRGASSRSATRSKISRSGFTAPSSKERKRCSSASITDHCEKLPVPVQRVRVAEAPGRDHGLRLGDELDARRAAGPPSQPAKLSRYSAPRDRQLPVGHDPGGEVLGAAPAPLELAHPAAREPAVPELVVVGDARQLLHRLDPAEVDEHAAEVEQDDVDGRRRSIRTVAAGVAPAARPGTCSARAPGASPRRTRGTWSTGRSSDPARRTGAPQQPSGDGTDRRRPRTSPDAQFRCRRDRGRNPRAQPRRSSSGAGAQSHGAPAVHAIVSPGAAVPVPARSRRGA